MDWRDKAKTETRRVLAYPPQHFFWWVGCIEQLGWAGGTEQTQERKQVGWVGVTEQMQEHDSL